MVVCLHQSTQLLGITGPHCFQFNGNKGSSSKQKASHVNSVMSFGSLECYIDYCRTNPMINSNARD